MKRLTHILSLLLLLPLTACQDTDILAPEDMPRTYRMRLDASLTGYDDATTRAIAYTFQNGDRIYVLFHQGNSTITGTATYQASTGEWTLTPSQSLTETDESRCQLDFFLAAGSSSATAVTLTQQTRIYTDSEASWLLSDGLLTVQGQLTPALGRIRFRGSAGQKCTVSGLAFAGSFDLRNHTFSLTPSKFTATCGTDGYTPYYYCAFGDTDKRQLTFETTSTSGLRRTFGAGVLQAGTSGFVTIPTTEKHDGWTLVNLGSGGEITFATVGRTTVSNVHSNRATLTALVTGNGGGHLSQTGFVIATHSSPTRTDRIIDCGTATNMETAVSALNPETTYYVRAFAVNEAGITYGEETSFRTIAKKDDGTNVEYDLWPTDENWNDVQGTDTELDYETWPADEDWNDVQGTNTELDYETWPADEDWN